MHREGVINSYSQPLQHYFWADIRHLGLLGVADFLPFFTKVDGAR
jgi:hypothetical protein